jgi:site-specific DNA-methyltransferase (adenine-specific)
LNYTLHHGNCLEVLRTLADNSIDSIVTDPPYGLRFMGKRWDYDVPGVEVWRECLRVLKPGGHLLSFGGSRTYHRMAVAIEDASFEIRDQIMWVYGSGFPKSLDVGKAIDAAAGAEREDAVKGGHMGISINGGDGRNERAAELHKYNQINKGALLRGTPVTPAAERWDGWGTALKPAHEPICMARKPLAGTVAANVLEWGTGAINVDGCRVDLHTGDQKGQFGPHKPEYLGDRKTINCYGNGQTRTEANQAVGRWPANFIHDGSEEVTALFPKNADGRNPNGHRINSTADGMPERKNTYSNAWNRIDGKPGYADTGSAARFFYCAKASPGERDAGLEALPKVGNNRYGEYAGTDTHAPKNGSHNFSRNHHPTVKPIALMRYLVRLITPPGGVVLDPFCGSGSTGCGAALEGRRFVGIEREAEYVEIARRRIAHWAASVELPLLALAAD